ncbi:MAG: amidohydrolase family protein [Anaerolineaceae bacterium]|nr:amidohydrolase family protein [Anaerolineaceae bacterium]
MKIIHAGQLIDGIGTIPQRDMVIIIENDRIKQILPKSALQIPVQAEFIDASQMTVMPGMVDCHVHIHVEGGLSNYELDKITHSQGSLALRASAYVKRDLQAGFTTIRCLDSAYYIDVALRDTIKAGLIEGPRMRAAGQGISVTGGHMDKATWNQNVSVMGRTGVGDGPWACRAAAREQIKRGADTIKINAAGGSHNLEEPWHQEMTLEEMAAVCEEARWAHVRVAAHAHGGPGITDAIHAGLNSVEHAPWLSEEQVDLMAEIGVFYVPTLTTHSQGLAYGKEKLGASEKSWNWILKVCDDRWISLERARRAGVKIALGTDAGFWAYHGRNAMELEEFIRGGFTPMQAIVASTRTGAECLDMDEDIGTLEPGKYADFIIVDGDPLIDIAILQNQKKIHQVFKSGKPVL